MIGDNFKDGTPVIICAIQFKCRSCGEIFEPVSIPVCGYMPSVCMMVEAIGRGDKENMFHPDRECETKYTEGKAHMCKDGKIGYSDFVGIRIIKGE